MADDQKTINKTYPLSVYRYMAKIGKSDIYFSEISGLSVEFESTEYKESGKNGVTTMLVIGQESIPLLTMKRGLFKEGLDLYDWFASTHTDKFTKKDIVISLLDNDNKAIMTWTIANAQCTKFEGPRLEASSNEVAFQTIELKGDTLKVKNA